MVELGDLGFPAEQQILSAESAQRAALMYISMGWAVTAGPGIDSAGNCACNLRDKCRNAGKHAYKGWGNSERRTLSADQAERYWSPDNGRWRDTPVDQVFIVPYLSGLVVADVDREEVWEALDEKDRPETLTQRSGSGRGGHRLYNFEWDTSLKNPPLMPGKLKRAAGEVKFRGIIAAAPSVHPSGGRYEWLNWGTPIVDAPESLIVRDERVNEMTYDWDTIVTADLDDYWIKLMFLGDLRSLEKSGKAATSRPLVLFATAASMAKWIAAGRITEDEVVGKLLIAAEQNGALDTYGSADIERQVRNGVRAGFMEKRS